MITLETLPYATAQEVFNQAANHLLTQMVRSENEATCLYRYDTGTKILKCAAGCFIGDSEYDKNMEKVAWTTLVERGKASENHKDLIDRLQAIHDNAPIFNWRKRLASLAHLRGLRFEFEEKQ